MKRLLYFSVWLFCAHGFSLSGECFGRSQSLRNVYVEMDTTAEKMLVAQRNSGGWPKQIDTKAFNYNQVWTKEFTGRVQAGFSHSDATIDNHATSREIRYLIDAYQKTKDNRYLASAEAGISYLLKMQYQNGGFPQFYPDTSGYRKHITYNDNAMLNALRVLQDVAKSENGFAAVNAGLKKRSALAVEKGIGCILKTQIRINGKPAVWCAQHDHVTLLPAKARSYELPSYSAAESVDITRFLMGIKNPSAEVKAAVNGAANWLQKATLTGFKTERIKDASQPKGQDVVVIPAEGAKIWARFYDLESGKPFFCGRDGIKKEKLSEIENERRTGYAYYGTWPEKLLLTQYPAWLSDNK
jgi:PelA/Pel-15E family pectate lyase